MSTVEEFILGLDGSQKAIVSFLHQRLTKHHELEGKIRFKIPMYFSRSWVCYLNPIKGDGIELAFMHGSSLSNEQGLLDAKCRKMVAGISIYNLNDIHLQPIDEIVQEALLLDEWKSKS